MANSINLSVDINVNDRNAQSKINKLKAGLATFNGMKAEIQADIVGGDKSARRLDELLGKLQKIHKIGNEKIDVFDLNSLKQLGPIIQNALKTATGKAKANLRNLQDDVNETLRLIQGRVDTAIAARSAQKAVGTFEQQGKYWNDRRQNRLRQIDEGLNIARQNNEYREQVSLLKEKVKLLEKIDKANGAKADSPALASARQELEATKKAAVAYRQQQRAQDQAARKAESDAEKLIKINQQLADIERRRTENQRTNADSKNRLQQEISLLQKKVALQRQSDMIANGGKASKATLATEAELNRQQRLNRLLSEQGGILGGLKSLAKQYLSIYAIWNFGKKVVETTGYFEQQRVALEGILGSAAEAEKAMTRLQSMALESPFELKDLVGQTKQLAAYGIESEKLLDTVKTLGDLSAGLGVDMSRLILAYGQVKSAAVLRGQELRQFTEAGIPMVQALADKFTQLNGKLVTTGEVFELISKRQVSFEMVASVLRDMTSEGGKFYNMQEQITETLYGQVQKLKDIWTQELNNLGSGNSSMLMGIVKAAQSLVKNIRGISIAGVIIAAVEAYKKLRIAAMQAAQGTGAVARSLRLAKREIEIFSYQIDNSQMKLKGLRKAMVRAGAASRAFGAILSSLAGGIATVAISALVGAVTQYIHAKRELGKKLEEINTSFSKDIAKMQTGFDNLASKIRTFAYDTKAYNEAMDALKANYGDYISSSLLQRIEDEKKGIQELTLSWDALTKAVHAAIEEQKNFEKSKAEIDAEAAETRKEKTERWFSSGKFQSALVGSSSQADRGTSAADVYAKNNTNNRGDMFRIRDYLRKNYQSIEKYIFNAFDSFTENGGRTVEDFAERLGMQNISDATIKGFLSDKSVIEKIFAEISSGNAYKKYINSLNDLESSPLYKADKAFRDAEDRAQKAKVGRYEDNPEKYNPISWDKNRQVEYLKATRDLVLDKDFFGNITNAELKKKFDEAFSFDTATDSNGNSIDALKDLGQTKRAADVIKELIDSVGDSDPVKVARLNNVLDGLIEKVGTLSDVARQVADRIDVELDKAGTKDKEMFYRRYMPTNETYKQMEDKVRSDRESTKKWLKEHSLWANDTGEQGEEYKRMKNEEAWLDDLFKNKYKLNEKAKSGGGSKYNRLRIVNFFDDILAMITKAEDAAKKVAGVTGWTDAMSDFFGALSDENYMKEFFKKGGKPFEQFFQHLEESGVTEFLPKGFSAQNIETLFKDAGWEEGKEFSAPDFKAMYKGVLDGIGKQVLEGLKKEAGTYAKGTPERNSLDSEIKSFEEFLSSREKAYQTRWGRNEVDEKLTAIIKSLTNIERDLEEETRKRAQYERLSKAGGPDDAYRAAYGTAWQAYDPRTAPQQALLKMLNGAEGGDGIFNTLAGEDLNNLLNSTANLSINSLRMLADVKRRIDDQRSVLTRGAKNGEKGAAEQLEQFDKVAGKFNSALDKLVEAIIQAYEKIPRSDTERKTIELENYYKQYKQRQADIEKDGKNIAERNADSLNQLFNDYAKTLGGTGNIFGEAGKGKSAGFMNFLGGGSGQVNFQQMIGNSLADKVKANPDFAGQAAGMAGAAGGAIAIVDAIIKFIYGAIKAIGEMIKATQKVQKSFNKATAYQDKYGNTQYQKKYDEHEMERVEKGTDIALTYNQHVMDGWEKFKGGDFVGALAEIYTSITDMIADINAFLDADVRDEIEKLIESNESLSKTIDKKEWEVKFKSGVANFNMQGSEMLDYWEQYNNYKAAYDKELNDTKATDTKALEEYDEKAEKARQSAIDIVKSIRDEVFGTADDLSSRLTDAFVNAFKNGTNAARDWAASVKEYMGEVLKSMILEKVIAPKVQGIIDQWMGGTEEQIAEAHKNDENFDMGNYMLARLKDEEAGKQAQKSLYALGDWTTDFYNGLGQWTKDMIAFNADTSSLSGGIQGMTEDTGRTLEGLGNSILFQHVQTNQKLDLIIALPFAQVQMSWFKDVQQQAQMIAAATQALNAAVNDVRNGVRPFHVVME